MTTEFLLSGHAQKRLKKRLHVKNIRRAYRDMELAYTKGKLIMQIQKDGSTYILFNSAVYIFCETICSICKLVYLITVYKTDNKIYQ